MEAVMARGEGTMAVDGIELLDSDLSRAALGVGALRLGLAEGLEALARCGGHHELGFASVEAYALERCERSTRWVQASRALARRLAGLPAVRRALVSGEIQWCMAQVIAGAACEADEGWWLEAARHRTVRQMQQVVNERAEEASPTLAGASPDAVGQMSAGEEARSTLTVTVDREAGWLFEAARMLSRDMGDRLVEETIDALLAEGSTSLWEEMDREAIVPFDGSVDERAAQRAWEKELARFREQAEARCEARIAGRARTALGVARRELTWNGGAEQVDAQLRRVAAKLARRDLVIGELAEAFWGADGWRRLGYATESQYVRERLGMSLSSLKAKRALARRARALPPLRRAVDDQDLGYEAARLVARVASPETAEAWMERARERTVKHLREEVDAAEMLARVGVNAKMAPPDETTMEKLAMLERRIASGSASLQWSSESSLQSDESQMFAGDGEGDRRARGRVTLKFRVSVGTHRHYRWLESLYLRHGPREGSFFRYLCLSFIAVWRERAPFEPAYSRVYARDRHRCTNPVCSRRDLTPHHLVFRSAGGDDSDENVASLCVWCHLEGVHGGKVRVTPPVSAMKWHIGRCAHTVVQGRKRTRCPPVS